MAIYLNFTAIIKKAINLLLPRGPYASPPNNFNRFVDCLLKRTFRPEISCNSDILYKVIQKCTRAMRWSPHLTQQNWAVWSFSTSKAVFSFQQETDSNGHFPCYCEGKAKIGYRLPAVPAGCGWVLPTLSLSSQAGAMTNQPDAQTWTVTCLYCVWIVMASVIICWW
jgi:hypothetical protein